VVSAFTTQEDAFSGRVGYRFDYRGRSIVVGGDGRVAGASAAANADVVLQGQVGAEARDASAGMVMLTGAENEMAGRLQVAEARAAGVEDVMAARTGMLVELPLDNMDINVRPL
jgi:carbon monoxide dehydrogenase subunit G